MKRPGLSSISEIIPINRHNHVLSSIQVRIPDISSRVGLKGIESVEISFISAANDRYFGNSSDLLFCDH